jgi:hypothetical protein
MKRFFLILTTIVLALAATSCQEEMVILNPQDMDTTYFPIGETYQWTYVRHQFQYSSGPDGYKTENSGYDTVTINVANMTEETNGWTFYLCDDFEDIGSSMKNSANEIVVFDWISIPPVPETDTSFADATSNAFVKLVSDTLHLEISSSATKTSGESWRGTYRLRDIGVIKQYSRDTEVADNTYYEWGYEDRLICFIKDQDTVWRSND